MRKIILAALIVACFGGRAAAQEITAQTPIHYNPNFDPTKPMMTIHAASDQTGNLFEFYNPSGALACYIDVTGTIHCPGGGGSTAVWVNGTPTTSQSPINFQSGTNITVANPSAGNIQLSFSGTLPVSNGGTGLTALGASGQCLGTNGSVMQWQACGSGSPGGSSLQLQYNNGGSFGGIAGSSWNSGTSTLTITGTVSATSFVSTGAGAAYTQWTTGSLSPGASGTVLCGANAGNVLACSANGGPLANVAVAGNDLQVYSGNVMSVAGFMLTSPGNMGTQPLTLQFNNDTTTGTVNDLLAKLGGVGASPSAIKIATTDTDIPVYPVTSATATSGAAILAVAGEATCTFDNATTYADYVVASTTTAADCHDAGASLPAGPVYVVGTIAQAGGAAGNYLVKGPGFFIAAVPASSPVVINGYCGGAVTASSFTYPFGMGGVNSTCAANDTVVNTGYVMPYAGTIVAMYVHAGISATTADVAAVQINGSYATPAVQCTIAASGNACSVTGASGAFNAGDYIGVKIGTGASDTLGDISVSIEVQ